MSAGNTSFDEFVAEEVRKYKGVAVPVKTGLLGRAIVRKVNCKKLHPNPEDEFCMPEIGPSYRIISEYERKFLDADVRGNNYLSAFDEPIIVEKMYPDGYMILNGHHRWAAVWRLGFHKVPIRIVNITHESDIRRMLERGENNKRVSLDLDEVVFRGETDEYTEKAPVFPLNKLYRERLRLGVPSLFHYLSSNGYDIWVYSSRYYSMEYINALFRLYHVRVDGIITGGRKNRGVHKLAKERIDKMFSQKYLFTLHIDSDMVLQVSGEGGNFREYAVGGSSSDWSVEVEEIIKKIERDEAG